MVTATKFSTSKKPTNRGSLSKRPPKHNASILSFFQKAPKPEDSLFVGANLSTPVAAAHHDVPSSQDQDQDHFHESGSPVKRRRLSHDSDQHPEPHAYTTPTPAVAAASTAPARGKGDAKPTKNKPRANGPFILDSDSEDGGDADGAILMPDIPRVTFQIETVLGGPTTPGAEPRSSSCHPPRNGDMRQLVEEEDSTYAQFDELAGSQGMDDLDLDDFEGEEMREMKFMREQARLEAEEAGAELNHDPGDDFPDGDMTVPSCPVCLGSLATLSADDATRHVNSCLDGGPTPLPSHQQSPRVNGLPMDSVDMGKRFARAAMPRPAQADPFALDGAGSGAESAFSRLMSGNAEDVAWATAAAAENATRGRPAHERTCPFYKSIPKFNICVDAFRYGAVEGCAAYFLSHFHSDHYIGLTANWRHGPIYCSKVTGSLVRQQLRTASRWIVELEFDRSYPVPGTGATVTMIAANHCPGSSLFLFQKPLDNGPNPRMKRVLHCGDFRACPEHVGHPLLKPDVVDSITGKTKQQTINTCYLDTTYLNPRYSFPPQEDVIKACADLCASMSADVSCKDDIWERCQRKDGAQAVSAYFQSDRPSPSNALLAEGSKKPTPRLLVVCGTYSIGKERICIAIAKALGSKIFATPAKMKMCKQLDDPGLASLLTPNPVEAQVHMQSLMEIRAETLQGYLETYKPHFSRVVGFRPSGWNFRPRNGKAMGANTSPSSIPTEQILHGKAWRTRFECKDFVPQRGSTRESMCFGVPYSEHSSFRELAMFLMSLRIEHVIPTVNVGSEQSRKRMRGWIDRWTAERRRGGLLRPLVERSGDDDGEATRLWEGKSGQGGGAWW